ncbi:hypothetical protein BXZ70DRAFT_906409 [Cristinia sonorae]|uniref:SWR1-complex protein 5 n=1 Tax=Cristinia sonorae TaxID=1940300 RepID=A0A8K0USV7_9AGAR|nr:hypothetical protein BXZ70DRAFT_906409 [Cristinia sonorae]
MSFRGDSESEDDQDYVPAAEGAGETSSDEEKRKAKRQRTTSPHLPTAEELEDQTRAREALWEEFKASASASAPAATAPTVTAPKMVKIEKVYKYAGEEVRPIYEPDIDREVKEVPEDSPDAKKWPRWKGPDDDGSVAAGPSTPARISDKNTSTGTSPSTAAVSSNPAPGSTAKPAKRPGPRKSKLNLAAAAAAAATPSTAPKPKKLTTLDMSAMEWRSHLESPVADAALKDELEANRRGGGYLEKVEFLQRVADRKEDALEATKSTKRRR